MSVYDIIENRESWRSMDAYRQIPNPNRTFWEFWTPRTISQTLYSKTVDGDIYYVWYGQYGGRAVIEAAELA